MRSEVKKVTVSSLEHNADWLNGENTIDGNRMTRWASEHSEPQWIVYEFAKPKEFDYLSIVWEFAFGKGYEIQTSDDATAWQTVFKQENGQGGKESFFLGRHKAKYVRFLGTRRGTHFGFSFYEFKLERRDDEKVPEPPKNVKGRPIDSVIFVDWLKNTETDVTGYNVYRSSAGEPVSKKLNTSIIQNTSFRDQNAGKGIKYTYYVTALDLAGNESRPSTLLELSLPENEAGRSYFDIPDCAWKRYLGDIPANTASSSPNRGIPLGGFGAGSFMYNISGSFGPFQSFDNVLYEPVWIEQAAFHFYERFEGRGPVVKTLSTDSVMKPAWNGLAIGDGAYYALYPKGWATYNCFSHDVSQKFFSPIIPGNYKETSYPVGLWEFKLKNPSDVRSETAVMLTMPGFFPGRSIKPGKFVNSFKEKDGVSGIVLKSDNGIGEWCIAAAENEKIDITYLTNWDGEGSGHDVYNEFSNGMLKNGALDGDGTSAAISVKAVLEPGEELLVSFAVSWDFPVVRFGEGTEWWKKYTQHFTRTADNSFAIACEALAKRKEWEKQIDAWMSPVIHNGAYPAWLKCSAFNELYYTQFGGFYEAGLKSGHKREDIVESKTVKNKYAELECIMYPYLNTFDVRHYSSIVFAYFWPEIERDTLLDWANAIIKYDPVDHQTPHDAGNPFKDPYVEWDNYKTNKLHWKDLHSKFIQQAWRYWVMYKDKEFLSEVWGACKATYEYMKKTDTNGDNLPDNAGSDNTYDAWGLWGTSLLCGGLWVGALEAFIRMAESLNDPISTQAESILVNAKQNLDKQLWYQKGGYYQIDTASKNSTAIMADGLNGQRYCEEWGLPDILPRERILSHLKKVYEMCVVPLKDFNGDGVGDCGALNGAKEDGTSLQNGQSDEIWTGSTYFLAASMHRAGLKEEALKTAYGVYYLTYIEETSAYWFNTPEAWHDKGVFPRPVDPEQYQRPRAVWELLLEISNPYKK